MKRQNNIVVDIREIAQIEHTCDLCVGRKRCCCSNYEICITGKEMKRIVGMMEKAAAYCPHLADEDNVFEDTGDGFFAIDTDEDGLCVFAYPFEGETRCALHSVALDMGLPLHEVKPESCLLWPISLTQDTPQRLTIDSEAYRFHCNRCHDPEPERIEAFRETLTNAFGPAAFEDIVDAANDGLDTVRIRRNK